MLLTAAEPRRFPIQKARVTNRKTTTTAATTLPAMTPVDGEWTIVAGVHEVVDPPLGEVAVVVIELKYHT